VKKFCKSKSRKTQWTEFQWIQFYALNESMTMYSFAKMISNYSKYFIMLLTHILWNWIIQDWYLVDVSTDDVNVRLVFQPSLLIIQIKCGIRRKVKEKDG